VAEVLDQGYWRPSGGHAGKRNLGRRRLSTGASNPVPFLQQFSRALAWVLAGALGRKSVDVGLLDWPLLAAVKGRRPASRSSCFLLQVLAVVAQIGAGDARSVAHDSGCRHDRKVRSWLTTTRGTSRSTGNPSALMVSHPGWLVGLNQASSRSGSLQQGSCPRGDAHLPARLNSRPQISPRRG